MAGTFSQLSLHIVFSTKRREPWINADLAARLHAYLGGIVRSEKGVALEVGGVEDHVHLLVRWRPDESISNLLRHVKARSSRWVHESSPQLRSFAWQEGYSVFSVSKSQEPFVRRYIQRQRDHHAREDFASELTRLLNAHEIEYDERYLLG